MVKGKINCVWEKLNNEVLHENVYGKNLQDEALYVNCVWKKSVGRSLQDHGEGKRMETERLLLRRVLPGDEMDLLEIRNSEFVLKYNCMKKVTLEELQSQIVKDMEAEDIYSIVLKENSRVIGMVDISPDTLRYGVNAKGLSYYLGEQYTGKGYMSEALREVIGYAFEELGVEVLSVRIFKANEASKRLIEKLGFVHEGCIRSGVKGYGDIIYDDMIYSMLRVEYIQSGAIRNNSI